MDENSIIKSIVKYYFHPRRWAACPNVSYGLSQVVGEFAEADLIAISKSGRIHEVEVKLTKQDYLANRKKTRFNFPLSIDYFWFAIPRKIEDFVIDEINKSKKCIDNKHFFSTNIEKVAGVFVIDEDEDGIHPYIVLGPKKIRGKNEYTLKKSQSLRTDVWRLCSLRYWSSMGITYGSDKK
jgi:hypothetical protein